MNDEQSTQEKAIPVDEEPQMEELEGGETSLGRPVLADETEGRFDRKEYQRKWYLANTKKVKEHQRKWCLANPEKEKERKRKYYLENPEKEKERKRKYYLENTKKVKEQRRKWCLANPEKKGGYLRKRAYGKMPGYSYVENIRLNPVCQACGKKEPSGRNPWHTDHCHTLNVVRGLLCHNCNLALGLAQDSIPRLEALIAYLRDPPALRKTAS